MNVAVVEPTSTLKAVIPDHESGLQRPLHQAEWIDPEGDDWFTSIYRELTQEPGTVTTPRHTPELDHWFG